MSEYPRRLNHPPPAKVIREVIMGNAAHGITLSRVTMGGQCEYQVAYEAGSLKVTESFFYEHAARQRYGELVRDSIL